MDELFDSTNNEVKQPEAKPNYWGLLIMFVPILIGIIFGLAISAKAFWLFSSLYCMGMYSHISLTTLSNALLGRVINSVTDVFWKLFFILGGCISITLFLTN